ncbi:MAG: ATPase [Pseudooceanicola sp.]|nr:ATPase [Pseudooceanicola sp.]
MTAQALPMRAAACPGCLAVPDPETSAQAGSVVAPRITLSLPGIHCQGCISGVESALATQPGVHSARVNLTLKRALIEADPGTEAEPLIAALAAAGYEARELDSDLIVASGPDAAGRALMVRLAGSGFAAMNVMLLSVAVWSGAEAATRDMFHWISAAITLPAIAYAAQPFFASAWVALRAGRLNMDVPIVLAILLSLVTSVGETAMSGPHAYFDAALTLTFFLLAGRYLDHRARAAARSAARDLTALEVPRALRREEDGTEARLALADLAVGDVIRVLPGARVPVDGVVIEGASEIDRALLTGETTPMPAKVGQQLCAGELNLTGALLLRATAVGADTSLRQMAELVAMAESGRANYAPLADAAARLYAPGVHILSALAFAGWYLYSGDLRIALNIAAAVLIITCPCALGLAVPAVTTAAAGRLFRKGLLVKSATALERLAQVDTVVFDKTGTLTDGTPLPEALDSHEPQTLAVAAALAGASTHPLARALAGAIAARGIAPALVSDIREHPGYGIEGTWQDKPVRLGRDEWAGAGQSDADTATWLATPAGVTAFRFQDTLREGAAELVRVLVDDGKTVVLLSGDRSEAVQQVAEQLGIDIWRAEVSPSEKAGAIESLAQAGKRVLMVGDGLNDTVALAAAHVSISPASAADAARSASDIVLLGTSLAPIAEACRISRKATARIRENFQLATLYNVIAVPLAIAGMATPLVAALAMSTSSLTVSVNALRLGPRR